MKTWALPHRDKRTLTTRTGLSDGLTIGSFRARDYGNKRVATDVTDAAMRYHLQENGIGGATISVALWYVNVDGERRAQPEATDAGVELVSER